MAFSYYWRKCETKCTFRKLCVLQINCDLQSKEKQCASSANSASRLVSYTLPSTPPCHPQAPPMEKFPSPAQNGRDRPCAPPVLLLSRNEKPPLNHLQEESCQTAGQVFTQLITWSFRDSEGKKTRSAHSVKSHCAI